MIKSLVTFSILFISSLSTAVANETMHAEPAVTLGDLELTGAFARATLPNQPVAGAFLTITNEGDVDDVLVAVSADFAGRGEVHEMMMDGDTMKMREMEAGLPLPAGETVVLKPGGYHLMFMQLDGPLVEGETIDATLTFEKAGDVSMTFKVMGRSAKQHMGGHGGHGS